MAVGGKELDLQVWDLDKPEEGFNRNKPGCIKFIISPWHGGRGVINSVREEHRVVKSGREYRGCGEDYKVSKRCNWTSKSGISRNQRKGLTEINAGACKVLYNLIFFPTPIF